MSCGSVKASRLATIRLVIRAAGKDVKSKAERKAAEGLGVGCEATSVSSLIRLLLSVGSFEAEAGRFRFSREAALRFFSSAEALSIRCPWTLRASVICPTY